MTTAIRYGLIAAGISVAIVAVVQGVTRPDYVFRSTALPTTVSRPEHRMIVKEFGHVPYTKQDVINGRFYYIVQVTPNVTSWAHDNCLKPTADVEAKTVHVVSVDMDGAGDPRHLVVCR